MPGRELGSWTRWLGLALSVATLASAGAVAARDDEPDDQLERDLQLLGDLDRVRLSIEEADLVLAQAVDELDERLPFPFRADWEALDGIGVEPRNRVSLDLADQPATTVLAALVLQLGDRLERPVMEVYAGQIVLTTISATGPMRLTDVYDLRDLLTNEHAADTLIDHGTDMAPDAAPVEPTRHDRDDDGEDDRGDDPVVGDEHVESLPPPRRPRTPGERLMMLIGDHVDPEGWVSNGGTRTSMSERAGMLMISAPPTVHRRVRNTLGRLRSAQRTALGVDVAIVDLPRDRFNALTRRFDLASGRLGRAMLREPDVAVRWRTTSAAAMDRELEITSESDEARMVRVRLRPTFDAAKGLTVVEVLVQTEADGDRRSLDTVITLPGHDAGAVLELPGAEVHDLARFVILIPRRG